MKKKVERDYGIGRNSTNYLVAHPNRPEAITISDNTKLVLWKFDTTPKIYKTLDFATNLNMLVVSPDPKTIGLLTNRKHLELRYWDNLDLAAKTFSSPSEFEINMVALSDDNRWIAFADTHENIYLVDYTTGQITSKIEGGEATETVLFDLCSNNLAAACSFQGGGHVRIDAINSETGELIPVYEFERSDNTTRPAAFVDNLTNLAFSSDNRFLVLFETSRIYHSNRPKGWRGNLVIYDFTSKKFYHQFSVDGETTKDYRSLDEIGHFDGFNAPIIFLNNETLLCGSTNGKICCYNVISRQLEKVINLNSEKDVMCLALGNSNQILWVLLSNGELKTIPVSNIK